MNCPNCQTNNPENARFCFNCGAALSQACSNCGASLQPGARFCQQCGQAIQIPAAAQVVQETSSVAQVSHYAEPPKTSQGQLERYIPKELLARLEAARRSSLMEGERRVVTILFCDVKGSTQAAAGLDPEEWAEIINGAFEHMIQPIYRYEGTVARLQGDGLLAFFGAPIAHEDDPQRAVLASLDIVSACRKYGEEVKERWRIEFKVRVGVNTGLVVVGAVGSDLRVEYTALGEAINLAARMEQNAQPDTVLVAEPTYKLSAPLFDFERVEGLEIKGIDGPVTAFRALRLKAAPGSLRGVAGLDAPLIGRQAHMDALISAANELNRGRGQLVSVMGEAGLGKSRLIAEFHRALGENEGQDLHWLEGRALSYETKTPFAPFIDMFEGFIGLQRGESEADQYAQVEHRLATLLPGRGQESVPLIASLLGLELSGEASERVRYLEPPQLRAAIFQHTSSLLSGLLASRPVVLYIDDLHWADPTSLELLQALLPLTDGAPLLIIAAFRPRRQEPSWGFHEGAQRDYNHRYQAINLTPLDEEQSRQLVASLLEIDDLPETVRRKILDKSEGNPFFVEEVIRSLLDNQLVVRVNNHWHATSDIENIDLPDTLNGVITARLDRLDETARRVLQSAAVLGREFSAQVLAQVVEDADPLEPVLVELQRRELVREKSRFPQPTYSFKHMMTQEAAYSSLLLSNRRALHRRAAEALIARSPEAVGEIARHLVEARQTARALPYLAQAGDRAARAYSTEEAIGYYRQVLELKTSATELSLVRQTYEGLGHTLQLANRIPEAQATFAEMQQLAESSGDIPMQISAVNKLAAVLALYMGQFQEADGLLTRAENLAFKHAEKASFPETALIRCQMCTAMADFDNVVRYMDQVIAIGQELDNKNHIAMGLEHVASSLVYMTRFDDAHERALEGLKVAREIGDREIEAWQLSLALPLIHIRNGDLETARASAIEGLEIGRKIGVLFPQAIAAYILSEIAHWRGEYELALSLGHESLEAGKPLEPFAPFVLVPPLGALGMVYLDISEEFTDHIAEFHLHALRLLESPAGAMLGGTAWADLCLCALTLGDLQIAEEALEKGLNYPNTFMWLERPRNLAGAALLACARGELDEALRRAEEARAFAEERQMRYLYPLTSLVRGKVLLARGEIEASLENLERAEEEARSLGMRPYVWQAQVAAAEALEAAGLVEQAESRRAQAKAMAEEIAGLFEDQELREAYRRNVLAKIR